MFQTELMLTFEGHFKEFSLGAQQQDELKPTVTHHSPSMEDPLHCSMIVYGMPLMKLCSL